METMNRSNIPDFDPGTPEEIEAMFDMDLSAEGKLPDMDRGHYFSVLDL